MYLNLSDEGSSDIYFEKISSITILDSQQVYDLEIEGTHNFIANDIVAHNTAVPPYINTSGLVLLMHFNNQSNFGENNSLVRDFSNDINIEKTGVRNNATCSGTACPTYNSSKPKFGKFSMWFDDSNDVLTTQLYNATWNITAVNNP